MKVIEGRWGQVGHSGRKMDEIQKNWKESNCTIIIFKKKKFEIICHMIGCNDSSGKHRQRGGTAFAGFCPPPFKVYDLD